ncbi:proteinase-activated receptor 3-like [Thunnus thynnus]|uniref:proteinase-activated receptor 3-like n=1 Tax=Thunnus thynnus TaxID=8237 RepID=UPI0035270A92
MAVSDTDLSVLMVSHRPTNLTNGTDVEETVYEQCTDMHEVLIWYLGLQFINMFLGIPANIMVLWLIHKSKADSTSDIFIFQLAILDVFFCLIPPLEVANIIFLTNANTWYVMRFFYGLKDFSPLLLSCICLDRYMAVVHPLTFNEIQDCRHRASLSIVVWLIILAYACVKCVGTLIKLEVFTVMILGAFAFMVYCNIAILRVLRQSWPGRDEVHPVKKRAFKMVLIILAIIVFNYLPPVALFPFKPFFSEKVFTCYIHYIAFGLMNFSSSVQPLLYLSKGKLSWSCCQTSTTQIE